MNQQKAMYLALVYRYLLNDVGRATKFYDLAKGIKILPRTHPIETLPIVSTNSR